MSNTHEISVKVGILKAAAIVMHRENCDLDTALRRLSKSAADNGRHELSGAVVQFIADGCPDAVVELSGGVKLVYKKELNYD